MLKDYFHVVKPWIVLANTLSAAGGFFLAGKGNVDAARLLATLTGIALVVASGCACNNCIDREIDRKMARTRGRAVARGVIPTKAALAYAAVLGLLGAAILLAGTNALCLGVVLAGFAVYVGVYTLLLKRRSAASTVVGSLAGAAPPVAAYCAVTGRFDLGAVLLLAVFGLWQIPHSYAITIRRLDDYAAAAIPVMPVVCGVPRTKRHIAAHIVAFTLAAQALTLCGYAGYAFLATATVLGGAWLFLATAGPADDDQAWAGRVYRFSMLAISVLCLMLVLEV